MPTKTYIQPEAAKTWTDTGGDYTMDLAGLAAAGVHVGAQGDLGADTAGRADMYAWQFTVDGFLSDPVVGEAINLYLAFALDGSNTVVDGGVGSVDAAGATGDLPNLMHLGSAIVETAASEDPIVISGTIQIMHRYVSPVVENGSTADALESNSDSHKFVLVPMPYESQ